MTGLSAAAQEATDALRFSFLAPTGTARSMGFGSALGSVGGDFTALSVNPAGIGIYRRGEVMFTPSLKFNGTDAEYLGDMEMDNGTRFNFNNLGIVFTREARGRDYDRASWKTFSFGIGMNRLAEFGRNYNYGGLMQGTGNEYSSFSEVFVNAAAADPAAVDDPRSMAYLGYQSYLVNEDSLGFYTLANWETGLIQRKSVQERGGINELVISLGGNYQEKLMIGATLGLPTVRYSRESYFEEEDATNDPNNYFRSFRYSENLQTTGMGVNLKLGMIIKPADNFRFGIALHTPTWFGLTDASTTSLVTNTETFKAETGQSDPSPVTTVAPDENRYTYRLTTPWRAILSATAFMGQFGFVSADYEYVDYKAMRFGFDNIDDAREELTNDLIRENFQGAHNFRLGFEARLSEFFGRAGFGYYGNPYNSKELEMTRTDLSLGIGYRAGDFFTDLAFVHSRTESPDQPYVLPLPVISPVALLSGRQNTFAWTIGWKF